jgi:hypothetical protein
MYLRSPPPERSASNCSLSAGFADCCAKAAPQREQNRLVGLPGWPHSAHTI